MIGARRLARRSVSTFVLAAAVACAPSSEQQPSDVSANANANARTSTKAPGAVPSVEPKADTLLPTSIWSDTRDVRSMTLDGSGTKLWVGSGGGLERFDLASSNPAETRALFGTLEGLDSLDVRLVRFEGDVLVVETGTARCESPSRERGGGGGGGRETVRFSCVARTPRPPELVDKASFAGFAVSSRLVAAGGEVIGTRGGGAFVLSGAGTVTGSGSGSGSRGGANGKEKGTEVRSLQPAGVAPSSFVHKAVRFRNTLVLGTFRDGLVKVALAADESLPSSLREHAQVVKTPFRMVNDLLVDEGVLFVAANEGLFSSKDGARFELVPAIGARSITGLATANDRSTTEKPARGIWVTSSGALYLMPQSGRGRVSGAWLSPAGSRSIQSVTSDEHGGAWLATEDRGVVHFDGTTFTAWDRLAGLPTSWVVAASSNGAGGVLAATLRHGFVQVARDGTWNVLPGAPGDWGVTVRRQGTMICMGSQEGARCQGQPPLQRWALGALPDRRVHLIHRTSKGILVGTESGLAVYAL